MSLRLIASFGLLLATCAFIGLGVGVAIAHAYAALVGTEPTTSLYLFWGSVVFIGSFGGTLRAIYLEYE